MTFRSLIRRSLRFHWRSHLGVVIGAAIGGAALTGALVVGDSVKGSLKEQALRRLAGVNAAMSTGDRFFQASLLDRITAHGSNSTVVLGSAPGNRAVTWGGYGRGSGSVAIRLPASLSKTDGSTRANGIQLFGVDNNYFADSQTGPTNQLWLNPALQQHLNVKAGDELLLRVSRPSALSRDAMMVQREESTAALRLTVGKATPSQRLDLNLRPAQAPVFNAFMGIEELGSHLNLEGRANLLLAKPAFDIREPNVLDHLQHGFSEGFSRNRGALLSKASEAEDAVTVSTLQDSLKFSWKLEDTESTLTDLTNTESSFELRTSRIFLDPPIERAALAADPHSQPILTYIANLIVSGTNATPYSMITAAGAPWTPVDLPDDEIVLNQWLAEDLQAKPGDAVMVVYYDPESGARLTERTNTFRVRSIVPMEMPWADRTLMPDFPGIEKAESTADWDTAFPLTYKIRDKDDKYWQVYRGTPKAFVTLAAGKRMWANRFGELTAVRFSVPTNEVVGTRSPASQTNHNGDAVERVPTVDHYRAALEQEILSSLDPAELGLRFEPVREQALKAAAESQDFGGLFIGFSLFLIAAALILMALLFQFGLEQRSSEAGTLLALGFTHRQVRRLLLGEGAALAFLGGVIGVVGGVFYAKAMLLGLTTVWRDAVGATSLEFFVTPGSLIIGLLTSTVVAVFTLWLALRRQAQRPAIALLNSQLGGGRMEMDAGSPGADGRLRRLVRTLTNAAALGSLSLALAVGLVGWALAAGETASAGVFFGAGALVLISGLALTSWGLKRLAHVLPASRRRLSSNHVSEAGLEMDLPAGRRKRVTVGALARRGAARRRSRSVATAALLACGTFLILSIGVFRLDADRDALDRSSGTGGFALIGESTIPVVADLNAAAGRESFALNEADLADVNVVQFRVRAGDEASCLNLNRAQKPRLLGVDPEEMAGRFTFAKVAGGLDAAEGWGLLQAAIRNPQSAMDAVPAIGDLNSILWAMGKKVGDTIDYTDDRGRPFKVRIVGAVANSILQGNLIIDEAEFVKRFPDGSGYQYFLLDAPTNRIAAVSATLSRAMQDYGLEITPAVRRLNQFNAVQNTYLGTFQILGGLGLLLGSAGLGIVVMRNVLERRGELAVLMAVGFRKRMIGRVVLLEHAGLLGIGLLIGLLAAAVAVLPTLLSPGSHLPYATLVPTLLAVLLNGLTWTWLATRVATRGNLLEALRNE